MVFIKIGRGCPLLVLINEVSQGAFDTPCASSHYDYARMFEDEIREMVRSV